MAAPPPPYKQTEYPQPGYPQPGYPQPGYPPPQQPAYPPPQQGYAPQAYMPPPGMTTSTSATNVVVVGQPQPQQTVVVQKQGVNHALHCIITFFFCPWLIVWIILCITEG